MRRLIDKTANGDIHEKINGRQQRQEMLNRMRNGEEITELNPMN